MKAEVALGLRLAGIARRGGWAPRWRSLSMFVAGVAGCYLLLTLAAITASEITQRPLGFVESGVRILLATVVLVVLTPVLTLAATTARLTAAIRDRQLANLRLIGLSARRTRLVAAAEGGVSAFVGAVVGAFAFVLTRPMLAQLRPAGRNWPLETLVPHWYAAAAAVALVPAVVVAVAMVPRVGRSGEALAIARRAQPGDPGLPASFRWSSAWDLRGSSSATRRAASIPTPMARMPGSRRTCSLEWRSSRWAPSFRSRGWYVCWPTYSLAKTHARAC